MKTKAPLFLAVVALLVGGCCHAHQRKDARQAEEKESQVRIAKTEGESKVKEMASTHNACTNWMESLPIRGNGRFFTVDLVRALVRTNGQPVLMEMNVYDLSEKQGVYTAYFYCWGIGRSEEVALRLELQCTAQQAAKLMQARAEEVWEPLEFAVVAKVTELWRPFFVAMEVESEDFARVFYAKGTCVDLLPINGTIVEEVATERDKIP